MQDAGDEEVLIVLLASVDDVVVGKSVRCLREKVELKKMLEGWVELRKKKNWRDVFLSWLIFLLSFLLFSLYVWFWVKWLHSLPLFWALIGC